MVKKFYRKNKMKEEEYKGYGTVDFEDHQTEQAEE